MVKKTGRIGIIKVSLPKGRKWLHEGCGNTLAEVRPECKLGHIWFEHEQYNIVFPDNTSTSCNEEEIELV